MGYRPTVICGKLSHEFGKFYGYVDHSNLSSVKWLIDHNKITVRAAKRKLTAHSVKEIRVMLCKPELIPVAE